MENREANRKPRAPFKRGKHKYLIDPGSQREAGETRVIEKSDRKGRTDG